MRPARPRVPLWSGWLAAALLVVLSLASCGAKAASTSYAPLPTPTYPLGGKFATAAAALWTPTAPPNAAKLAPVPGIQANWTALNLPTGFGMSFHQNWLAVSANGGGVAYGCTQYEPNTPVETIKSVDRGATWTRMADLNRPWGGCMSIQVDDNNPQLVVMYGGYELAVSRDGGQSWRVTSPAPQNAPGQIASAGPNVYGRYRNSSENDALEVSADGLVTWRDITPPIPHTLGGYIFEGFWVNPVSSSVLVETNSMANQPTLWFSNDVGAHWSSVSIPFAASLGGGRGVAAKAGGATAGAWTICLPNTSNYNNGSISCSIDSGATWRTLPGLYDPGLRGLDAAAIADDGAVLALGMGDTFMRVYRLAPGATRWQNLGDAPETMGQLVYARVSGAQGELWSFPDIKGGGSGDANPSDILVARYPY